MSTAVISDRKFAANRANAQLSTGPQSDPGKQRARLNALRHGFFAKSLLLPGDDPAELEQLKADFLLRLNPRDVLELRTVDSVIANHWRLARLRRAECRMLTDLANEADADRQYRIEELKDDIADAQYCGEREREKLAKATGEKQINSSQNRLDLLLDQIEADKEDINALGTPIYDVAIGIALRSEQSRAAYDAIQRHIRQIENALHRAMRQLREMRKEELPDELHAFARDALEQLNPNRCDPLPPEASNGDMDNDSPIGLDVSEDVPAAPDGQPAAIHDSPAAQRADAGGSASQNVRNEPTIELDRGAQVDFGSQGDGQFDPLRR